MAIEIKVGDRIAWVDLRGQDGNLPAEFRGRGRGGKPCVEAPDPGPFQIQRHGIGQDALEMRDRHVGHAFKVQAVLFGDLDIVAQAGDLVQHHAPRPGHTAEDRHEDHIDRKQRAERQRHGQGAAMLQVHAHQQYRKARQNRQRGQAADHGRGLAVMAPVQNTCAASAARPPPGSG